MSTVKYIQDMVTRFREILDKHDKHLECFCRYGVQVESWLKGELLYFFDVEKTDGRLLDFDRERQYGAGKKRVDYYLVLPSGIIAPTVWIELKHWQIGYQKNELWRAHHYFGDKSIGLYSDVEKLNNLAGGDKYILVLATENPGHADWLKGVEKFNQNFAPLHVKAYTDPSSFPQNYFLGLLEVTR